MKRLFVLLFAFTVPLFAQESKMTSKVFTVHYRQPSDILSAVTLLGSGAGMAAMHVNNELKTLTVRDYPENIAQVEDAIKRLDVPAAEAPVAQLTLSVLIGTKTAAGNGVPDDLEPVVKELKSALRYSHYGLVTTAVQRVTSGAVTEGSGTVDASLLGSTKNAAYHFRLRKPAIVLGEHAALSVEELTFGMHVDTSDIGFDTPLTIRDGETVVIGTSSLGDKALILVVNAKIGGK